MKTSAPDDVMDHSTDEPTMDGAASAILMFAFCTVERWIGSAGAPRA